jgi:hypothetical protein
MFEDIVIKYNTATHEPPTSGTGLGLDGRGEICVPCGEAVPFWKPAKNLVETVEKAKAVYFDFATGTPDENFFPEFLSKMLEGSFRNLEEIGIRDNAGHISPWMEWIVLYRVFEKIPNLRRLRIDSPETRIYEGGELKEFLDLFA